ncbi:MAG: DUF5610 domain-containing protein [Pontibacterium sp.]
MSINNFGQTVSSQTAQPERKLPQGQQPASQTSNKIEASASATTGTVSPQQQAKTELNRSIVEASLSVSINTGNESMALLYKAAAEQLNEVLEPQLGPRPLDAAVESGLDVSPEATADRIVSLTTGLFSRFQDANPDLKGAELTDHFVDVIGGGILQGFNEARDILDGMNVLEGDIAGNIDLTYDLVVEKLEQFRLDNGGTATADSDTERAI